jgi:DNA invertase Pin-like site-specific DNA recombinase
MNAVILNIERTDIARTNERTITHIDPFNTTSSKLKVGAYARVSSDSTDQLDSYISQVRYYTQIIRENSEWEYVDIYADEGISGLSADKRPEFQRMMADSRQRKLDRILVKSVSRFARNFFECIEAIRELKMLGVTVMFEKENIDTAKMSDELEITLQGLWAQKESISLSSNLRRGLQMKMKTGTFLPSSAPYGYELDGRTLKIVDSQADVVRRIYEAYLSGQGVQDIADDLNRKRIPKRIEGDSWHYHTIYYILTNVSYTGDAIWQKTYTTESLPFKQIINKGEKKRYYVHNNHPSIVSQEDFAKVQGLMKQRLEKQVCSEPDNHLLSKKVECGLCGSVHRRKVARGKVYWTCRQHDHSKAICPAPQIPETEIEAAFIRMWNKLNHHRQEIIAPMLEEFRAFADRRYKQNDNIRQVNTELETLSEQVLVLNRLKNKGYMESALWLSKTQEAHTKIKELRTLKAGLMDRDQAGGVITAIESLDAALAAGPEWLESMDRDLFEETVDKIIVLSPEQIKIRLYCGLELIENIQKVERSHKHPKY